MASALPEPENERIQVVGVDHERALWAPVAGEEAYALLHRRLPREDEGQRTVLVSAVDVLSQCTPPATASGTRTGLVIGYVQSGKTLSFTTVAALANDNDYRIVIVMAGTTNDLANQSRDRLRIDLGLEETPFTRWQHYHNPGSGQLDEIRNILREWNDPNVSESERRTVLITLLKFHTRLVALTRLLTELELDANVPTLIIDDEADQASLNNLVRRDELSTTYACIRSLQDSLMHHSFLQYTATPQANLLINLIDVLSPETVTVLEPGRHYVGGATIFADNSPYVRIIPPEEIPRRDDPFDDPPSTLLEAMALFFVGVASGIHRRDGRPRNRSMMVHPSQYTVSHRQYFNWIRQIQNLWIDILRGTIGPDERAALMTMFRDARDELAHTVADLESFDVLERRLQAAVSSTLLRELNTPSDTREIRWNSTYSWILVGGRMLDRGFTVEGLTITYMPRGPGVGNADTIQQRARFLGYKGEYLGFCRVFLEQAVANLYHAYVSHEEDIRNRLTHHAETGRPLSEFRRAFICDRALRPTRQSVLDVDFDRPSFRNGWYTQSHLPQDQTTIDANSDLVKQFLDRRELTFNPDFGADERTSIQRHNVAPNVPLQLTYDALLSQYDVGNIDDDRKWIVALIIIDRELERHPDATCTIFQMSYDPVTKASLERRRQVREGTILNLMQGPSPDASGATYPGDRQIVGNDTVTIQLHNVTFTDGPATTAPVIFIHVPIITMWMAPEIRVDVVVQDQGG